MPSECQDFLERSESWGYRPNGPWQPAHPAQGLEVAEYMADLSLVPKESAAILTDILRSTEPSGEGSAHRLLARVGYVQMCDPMLALRFVEAILQSKWSAEEKRQVGRHLHQFIVNQQARIAPTTVRAVSLRVAEQAMSRGFMRGDAKRVRGLQKRFDGWMKDSIPKNSNVNPAQLPPEPTALERWTAYRKEMAVSQRVREELSKLIPLP
jgi:hypothetical protein